MKTFFYPAALLVLLISMKYEMRASHSVLKKEQNVSGAYIDSVLEAGRIERMKSKLMPL